MAAISEGPGTSATVFSITCVLKSLRLCIRGGRWCGALGSFFSVSERSMPPTAAEEPDPFSQSSSNKESPCRGSCLPGTFGPSDGDFRKLGTTLLLSQEFSVVDGLCNDGNSLPSEGATFLKSGLENEIDGLADGLFDVLLVRALRARYAICRLRFLSGRRLLEGLLSDGLNRGSYSPCDRAFPTVVMNVPGPEGGLGSPPLAGSKPPAPPLADNRAGLGGSPRAPSDIIDIPEIESTVETPEIGLDLISAVVNRHMCTETNGITSNCLVPTVKTVNKLHHITQTSIMMSPNQLPGPNCQNCQSQQTAWIGQMLFRVPGQTEVTFLRTYSYVLRAGKATIGIRILSNRRIAHFDRSQKGVFSCSKTRGIPAGLCLSALCWGDFHTLLCGMAPHLNLPESPPLKAHRRSLSPSVLWKRARDMTTFEAKRFETTQGCLLGLVAAISYTVHNVMIKVSLEPQSMPFRSRAGPGALRLH